MDRPYRLTAECHLLSDEDDTGILRHVVYFPLQSLVFRVNTSALEVLAQLRRGPMRPTTAEDKTFLERLAAMGVVNGEPESPPSRRVNDEPRPVRTMLLTSDRCNLRCAYCYGDAGGDGDMMPMEIALAAVRLLIRNAVALKQRAIHVSFHGGGEPTVNWLVLREVIETAEKQCQENNLTLTASICTNGMLDEKQVHWLARHMTSVVVSVDGPPEIQDAQRPTASGRPSFDRVARALDQFKQLDKPLVFRMTATALSTETLGRNYRYLVERFAPRSICIEPLFVCGRCHTSDVAMPEAETFIQGLKEVMQIARDTGVPMMYSGGRLNYLNDRFCGAAGDNFFVTPRGEVTSCVEISDFDDPRSKKFIYGQYCKESGEFEFDTESYRALSRLTVHTYPECKDCFARWHCAGDCPAKAPDGGKTRNTYRCEINRQVLKTQLFHMVTMT